MQIGTAVTVAVVTTKHMIPSRFFRFCGWFESIQDDCVDRERERTIETTASERRMIKNLIWENTVFMLMLLLLFGSSALRGISFSSYYAFFIHSESELLLKRCGSILMKVCTRGYCWFVIPDHWLVTGTLRMTEERRTRNKVKRNA